MRLVKATVISIAAHEVWLRLPGSNAKVTNFAVDELRKYQKAYAEDLSLELQVDEGGDVKDIRVIDA